MILNEMIGHCMEKEKDMKEDDVKKNRRSFLKSGIAGIAGLVLTSCTGRKEEKVTDFLPEYSN